jgi:hypothetical protein
MPAVVGTSWYEVLGASVGNPDPDLLSAPTDAAAKADWDGKFSRSAEAPERANRDTQKFSDFVGRQQKRRVLRLIVKGSCSDVVWFHNCWSLFVGCLELSVE